MSRITRLANSGLLALLACAACSLSGQSGAPRGASVGTVRAAVSVATDYKSIVLADGPVGYWRLGELAGPSAMDAAPAGNNGTYTGSYPDTTIPALNQPGALSGDPDGAALFYLSNNYNHSPPTQTNFVSIPNNLNQAPSQPSLTLEAWFTMAPGKIPQTYSAVLSKSTSNWQDGYGLYWYVNTLYFFINNMNIRVGTLVPNPAAFHHVVGTYDGNYIRIYLDGALAATRPIAVKEGQGQRVNASSAPLQIGKSWVTCGWQGEIDEVALYDKTLPPDAVLAHYNAATASVNTFVAYADKNVLLGTGDQTSGGGVGITSIAPASFGPQLTVGSLDKLDPAHKLFAPSVVLGAQAAVGSIAANSLNSGAGATSGTLEPYPGVMPRLPLALPSTPGTTDVTVAQGQTRTLNPGSFGVLTDGGVVYLSPGTYSFASVALGDSAQLVAQAGGLTDLRIAGALSTGTFAQILTAGQQAGAFRISVSGSDGPNGAPPAAALGANSHAVAVIAAPRGTLSFGNAVTATGAFAAFSITAGDNVSLTFQSGLPPPAQQPVGHQQLSGYVTPDIAAAPLVGPVPQSTMLTLGVSLPVQVPADFPALADFAQQVSDPTSARYRQFLIPDQYASHYAPSNDTYNALTDFTQSYGLSILNSYPDHELADVRGTAAQISQLLFSNLNYYLRPDGTQFFALDREPSLATSLPILHVAGTSNFVLPTQAATAASGSGPKGRLLGSDLRNAYLSGCGDLDGTGQAITLIEIEGFNGDDIDAYSSAAGLPSPTISTGDFSGSVSFIFHGYHTPPIVPNNDGESPLDIEMAHAMAPRANLVVYQSSKAEVHGINSVDLVGDMMHAAAHRSPLSNQVSSSWFFPGSDDIAQSLNAMAAQGQSFFESSGDGGVYTTPTDDIRSLDLVTVVGGTILTSFAPGSSPTEAAWPNSGGGFLGPYSTTYYGRGKTVVVTPGRPIPSYQVGFVNDANQAASAYRNVPDVSMVATNLDVFDTENGQHVEVFKDGTSASAPLFAGFMALSNQKAALHGIAPVGFANPVLYAIGRPGGPLASACFNDVQDGSNPPDPSEGLHGYVSSAGALSPPPASGFAAVAGYDLATGLGSPTCALLTQLASPLPTVPVPPPPPPASVPPSFVGLGYNDSCGIVSGAVECWGLDKDGENGTGVFGNVSTVQHLSPACTQMANGGSLASSVAVGAAHSCAVFQSDGAIWCWGDNTYGQLGADAVDVNNQPLPNGTATDVAGFPIDVGAAQISAGGNVTCALLTDATVWCWGSDDHGQLGNGQALTLSDLGGKPHPLPTQVQIPPANQVAVSPLGAFACALLQSGGVDCWGSNTAGGAVVGTLGRGSGSQIPSMSPTPEPVVGVFALANATSIAVGDRHACALIQQGAGAPGSGLWCWGDNTWAELGQGSASTAAEGSASLATEVSGVPMAAVACGSDSTCVLLADGTVECWGDNSFDKLGNGDSSSAIPQPHPEAAVGLAGVTAIAGGPGRYCAQRLGGAISCWGLGPVGNGTSANVNKPTSIPFGHCP